jgi:broad specificity phosphatase PhoE
MTRLILIRHGETDWNHERRYISFTDAGLNATGIAQAEALRRRLTGEKVSAVYSSDSVRASDFARLVFKGHRIEKLPGLREMSFGVFEGLNHEEITRRYPGAYDTWLKDPIGSVIPEGERWSSFSGRVTKIFKKIISLNKGRTAAVVTHAGPIRVILGRILRPESIWDIMPASASVTIVEFSQQGARLIPPDIN